MKDFNISYEIPDLFTKGNFKSSIELNGEPKVTKLLTESCKMLIAKRYKCSKKDIIFTDISVK